MREKTNSRLTRDVSTLEGQVPSNLTFEPSAGTVANNLATYLDVSTGKDTLYIKSGNNWVSIDVSVLS